MQVRREYSKFKFVKNTSYQIQEYQEIKNDIKRKKKQEMFKIPHKFKQAQFQENKKNTPNERVKFKRKNSDKQSIKEVKSAKGRDNKENQTLKA